MFSSTVLPVFEEHCFRCHGPAVKTPKGGLRISGREALLLGGDSGPAIVPSDPAASLLVQAIRWDDRELQMPPKTQLPDEAIAAIELWIADGAAWPVDANAAADVSPAPATERTIDPSAGRSWWSFEPVRAPTVPAVAGAPDTLHPIDAFVRARLAAEGLAPAPEADARTLARRVAFDLIGLPPTAEEIERFAADRTDGAWERWIDSLLARPEYGERWARHWLDVVRYAETSGFERDEPKLVAWRYRDWVVGALNADLPFDRFVLEQLAGDELDEVTADTRAATGFYRLGPWDSEPDDGAQAEFDELDDVVRTIGEGFLGVTIGCARCHDHKFDPFPQEDYYGLLAFVRNVRRMTVPRFERASALLAALDADPAAYDRWEGEREAAARKLDEAIAARMAVGRKLVLKQRFRDHPRIGSFLDHPPENPTPAERKTAERIAAVEVSDRDIYDALGPEESQAIRQVQLERMSLRDSFPGSLDWALVVTEAGAEPPPTHLLVRGQAGTPAQAVEPHFPLALVRSDASAVPAVNVPANGQSSGRRRALAEWIASPDNPLTARVIVNRVWQHHFGRGIVATPNDFGSAGEAPSHPELLDWLAAEFVRDGWSLKRLHRLILTSATWKQVSGLESPLALERDPDNRLLWRQNPRRLEAEAVRDSMLAVSGALRAERGGPSFFEPLDRSVLAGSSRPGEGYAISPPEQFQRRSLYGFVKRNLPSPLLEAFDAANTSLPEAARASTTVPTQALTLLNGTFAGRAARALAARVLAEAGADPELQVRRAFELALARPPSAEEAALALAALRSAEAACARALPELVFESCVPQRVDVDFLRRLLPRDILRAPDGFTVLRGRWGELYNHTRAVDRGQAPAALFDGAVGGDGEVRARLRLRGDAPFAALLLRARPNGDLAEGLEVRVEPGALRILEHAGAETTQLTAIARATAAGEWFDLRVVLTGPRVQVFAGEAAEPVLTTESASVTAAGSTGIRTLDSGTGVAHLEMAGPAGTFAWPVVAEPSGTRALAVLCLTLQNLSEFISID